MAKLVYDTTDPAVRARLVRYIADEQDEIDAWRSVPADSRWAPLAASGIEAAQAVMAMYVAALADGNR